MGIDNEGHPCGFCFVVYYLLHLDMKLGKMQIMLLNLYPKLLSTAELYEWIGTPATKREGRREEEPVDNSEEMISGTKMIMTDPGENLLMRGRDTKDLTGRTTETDNMETTNEETGSKEGKTDTEAKTTRNTEEKKLQMKGTDWMSSISTTYNIKILLYFCIRAELRKEVPALR